MKVPCAVLGGSGYVGAEAVRLLLGHPRFELRWIVSRSRPGALLVDVYPHLKGPGDGYRYIDLESFLNEAQGMDVAVIAALPHGVTAAAVNQVVESVGPGSHVVDLSADFRLGSHEHHSKVYSGDHGAPGLFGQFTFGLPELSAEVPPLHVSNPGCFATCMTLACAPLVQASRLKGPLFISGVTGSTGSGSSPKPGTHHPHRTGNHWAYDDRLGHRHVPEVVALLSGVGGPPEVFFVPHSGDFARGIHVTVQAEVEGDGADLIADYEAFYEGKPFVSVSSRPPSVREVTSTNRCHIGVAGTKGRVVLTAVIDNIVKGAAGDGVQWLNRIYGFDERDGLWAGGDMWA